MSGSWRKGTGYLRRRIINTWENWRMKEALDQSRKLGKTRGVAAVDAAVRPAHLRPHV
jgi:hypothetical protein